MNNCEFKTLDDLLICYSIHTFTNLDDTLYRLVVKDPLIIKDTLKNSTSNSKYDLLLIQLIVEYDDEEYVEYYKEWKRITNSILKIYKNRNTDYNNYDFSTQFKTVDEMVAWFTKISLTPPYNIMQLNPEKIHHHIAECHSDVLLNILKSESNTKSEHAQFIMTRIHRKLIDKTTPKDKKLELISLLKLYKGRK